MREIKFRGRSSKDKKTWFTGSLVYLTDIDEAFIDHYDGLRRVIERYPVDPTTVGQFTGLLDEDRREIYEGDILNIDGEFIAEVVYCDGAYELYTKQGTLGKLSDIAYEYSLAILDGVIETFSVIGNIHDNPELLERKP